MPVIANETVNGDASGASSPVSNQATAADCNKNGSQQEGDANDREERSMPPPSLQGYKQLNDGSSSESTPISSANSSILESGSNGVEGSCAASTLAVGFAVADSTSEDNNAADADDEEGEDEAGNISSLESSLSNYTDCESNLSSEDESVEFKSLNGTEDEEARPLLLADVDDEQVQNRRISSSSESSDVSHVSETDDDGAGTGNLLSLTSTSSSSSSSDSDSEMPIQGINKLISVPSNLPSLPSDVEKENRKNIIKTLQGQAEIITNWSLVKRSSDGRKMWMLMGGTPYDFANKIHNNFRPPSPGGSSIGLSLNVNKATVVIPDCSSPAKDIGKEENVNAQNESGSPKASTSTSIEETVSTITTLTLAPKMASLVNISDNDEEDEEECDDKPTDDIDGMQPSQYKRRRLYPCGKCNMYLTSKLYWYKHVIKEHGREEREKNRNILYSCRYCPKQFGFQRSRNAHEKTHGADAAKKAVPTTLTT